MLFNGTMHKILSILPVFVWSLTVVFLSVGMTQAADTDSVSATVTVQNISLSVADGSVSYGTLATNSSANTTSPSDEQTITNDGNVTIDVNIRGADTAAWTLAGTAGANAYIHRFCTATCGTYPTNYTIMTTSYAELATGVAAAGTQALHLGITTPTSSVSYTQQTADVTVQAVLP